MKGGCIACHEPHSSDSPKFLRSDPPKLCYSCHEDLEEDLSAAAVVHGPVSTGCVSCHDPHRTLAGGGLKGAGSKLCMTCHGHFKAKLAAMSKYHSELLENPNCLRCHEAHSATRESLLSGSSQKLCLTCHEKDIKTDSDRVISGLGAEIVEGARLHGPLVSQNCAGCHEPHGNARGRFLLKAYPPGFYSPYTPEAYAMCFSCHDSALTAKKHTTKDTMFRDGDVNLHYLHVNKTRKGRTCRACHAAHATKNPHMLSAAAPFGEWKIPIGFTKEDSGGTCASGCHPSKTYNREGPVTDNRTLPIPKASVRTDKEPEPTTSPSGSTVSNGR